MEIELPQDLIEKLQSKVILKSLKEQGIDETNPGFETIFQLTLSAASQGGIQRL